MYYTLNHYRCFAEVLGQGPALVCLHGGFGFDHSYFRPALDALAQSHQLILLDLPGNGRSDALDTGLFSIAACVDAVEQLRVELGLETWSILGHSGGGLVAATYAAQYTNCISRLMLIGSFPSYPFEAPALFAKVRELGDSAINEGLQMFLDGVATDDDYRTACLKYAPMFFADPRTADVRVFEKIRYRVRPYNETVPTNLPYDAGSRLHDFHQPTLIIHGTHDYRVPLTEARRWLDHIPHAHFKAIANTGHFPFLEQPAEVTRLIASALA